jgi:hypothetical protein
VSHQGELVVLGLAPLGPALLPISFRLWNGAKRNRYDTDYHQRNLTYPSGDEAWLYLDKEDLDDEEAWQEPDS